MQVDYSPTVIEAINWLRLYPIRHLLRDKIDWNKLEPTYLTITVLCLKYSTGFSDPIFVLNMPLIIYDPPMEPPCKRCQWVKYIYPMVVLTWHTRLLASCGASTACSHRIFRPFGELLRMSKTMFRISANPNGFPFKFALIEGENVSCIACNDSCSVGASKTARMCCWDHWDKELSIDVAEGDKVESWIV